MSLAPDLTITSWNKGAEKLLGFSAAEAVGQSTSIYVPPELRERAEKFLRDLQGKLDRVNSFEVTCLRKDGSRVDTWTVVFGIRDRDGRPIGMSAIHRDLTERKQAEHEREQLAAIVNASEDVITAVNKELVITSWNLAAEGAYGYLAAEAIGKGLDLFVPAGELPQTIEATNRVLLTGEPQSWEQHAQRPDGTPRVFSVNIFALRDERGRVTAVAGIGRDITERTRVEHEQKTLAAIVDASDDAIVALDRDLKIISWNHAAQETYGFTAEQALGKSLALFVRPEEVPKSLEASRRALETGETIIWEQTARRKEGPPFVSLVSVFPTRDDSDKIIGVAGIGRDITKMKQAEKELRAAQEYTRGLIESSIDAMVVVDRELRITDGNEQLAKLTKMPKKMLIGSRFDGYFEDPARAAAAIEKTLADGYITNYDLVMRPAGGSEIQVSFNASIFYSGGKVFGIFGVARDVTEERATKHILEADAFTAGASSNRRPTRCWSPTGR